MCQIVKRNKGFALPSAIFLLVVIGIMTVGLLMMNKFYQKNSGLDTLDIKAYQAAKYGLEYGLYQANKASTCLASGQTIAVAGVFFQGFKVTYTCTSQTSNEAGTIVTYYKITAVGCNTAGASCPEAGTKPASEDYVEKSLSAVLAQ